MENIANQNSNLQKILSQRVGLLAGKLCWAISGGAGTGSIIVLKLGEKIPREKPLMNQSLSADERKFEAQISLMIYCAWRIDTATEVICSSQSSNEEGGPMLQGLGRIVGASISSISITQPGNDLEITFGNGFVLHVFCDVTDTQDADDNYVLYEDGYILAVSARSKVTCED